MSIVSIDRADGIAVVTVDNPPVNALSQALRQGLWDAVATLDADPAVRGVVLVCAGRTFIAGADVTEFGKPPVPPLLTDLVDRLESAAKPWLAAIHGSTLGGGFEVAMGCRFRVALDSASVGLPEVNLGIVPGASGTVRTPRLAGVAAAVEMVTTGRPVRAARALDLGLVDAVVSGDLRAQAVAFLRGALERALPPPVSARPVASPDPDWWEARRGDIARARPGEDAPLCALDCLRAAAEKPFAEALAEERATFLRLRGSAQAAALRHVFFAERAAPRPPQLAGARAVEVGVVAVVGQGDGAADIAAAVRNAGLAVHLIDDDEVRTGESRAALAGSDLVIIAGAGGTEGRPDLLGGLDRACRADAVLASLVADEAPLPDLAGLAHPERWIGLRLTGQAKAASLLEIASLGSTSPNALAAGVALAKGLRLLPILSGNGSFIGGRLLQRCRTVADALLAEGYPAAEVEAALRTPGAGTGSSDAGEAAPPALAGDRPSAAHRLARAMAEEGRLLLAEGIAARASDIDLVAIHLLGFPRWQGGPMFASGIT